MAWLYFQAKNQVSIKFQDTITCLYNCIVYGWKKHIPLKSEKTARNSVKIISRSTCQKMSISISLVLQKRNITMKKKSSSALSNHKIVLFFTHHDFLFHFFLSYFCHLEAIYLGIEEVRLKFNQKKSIQVHKATAWFFFLTHKYKIGPCHLPDFS